MSQQHKPSRSANFLIFGMLILAILLGAGSASAADYRFSVPESLVIFAVDSDGKGSVSYEFTIENEGAGLDYIDIALPNNNYSLTYVQATINGTPVEQGKISRANYQDSGLVYGITIDNTRNPIPAGQSAEIYVEVSQIGKLLYTVSDTEKTEAYVSFQFEPNYFSPKFAFGKTNTTIRLVLPTGITSEEPVYFAPEKWPGDDAPESWFNDSGNVVYEWKSTAANSSTAYLFGAMFPQRVLTSQTEVSDPSTYEQNQVSQGSSGGNSIFGDLSKFFGFGVFILIILLTRLGKKTSTSRKTALNGSYLPPSIKAEGEGIKRGLTAVEAAVLLEQPVDKIISMIIFSLTKKGAIEVIEEKPLKIRTEDPLPEKLMDYETGFIEAMAESSDKKRQAKMTETISELVLSVTKKMQGFSLADTKAYYQSIIEKAWQQVQDAGSPELKGEKLDEIFGWVILDSDIENKTQEVFGSDPVFLPTWWWRMGPIYHTPAPAPVSSGGGTVVSTPSAPSAPSGGSKSTPTLPGADFARSITDSVRTVGVGTVGSVKTFTDQVTVRTNPAAAPSGRSDRSGWSGRGGGGGGGSSCACACACAGCACAGGGGGGGR